MVVFASVFFFFFSSRRRHTRFSGVTGVQTWLFRSAAAAETFHPGAGLTAALILGYAGIGKAQIGLGLKPSRPLGCAGGTLALGLFAQDVGHVRIKPALCGRFFGCELGRRLRYLFRLWFRL